MADNSQLAERAVFVSDEGFLNEVFLGHLAHAPRLDYNGALEHSIDRDDLYFAFGYNVENSHLVVAEDEQVLGCELLEAVGVTFTNFKHRIIVLRMLYTKDLKDTKALYLFTFFQEGDYCRFFASLQDLERVFIVIGQLCIVVSVLKIFNRIVGVVKQVDIAIRSCLILLKEGQVAIFELYNNMVAINSTQCSGSSQV